MKKLISYTIFLFLLSSCGRKSASEMQQERVKNFLTPKDTSIYEDVILVNDSVRNLIDQLQLCEKFIIEDDCYNSRSGKFIQLTSDSSYNCFLFNTEGGSGGEVIEIYNRKSGKHELVNDIFAFYDTIPGTLTKGYYDLYLDHRDYDRGYITALYKWNGKQYIQDKILSINFIPIDLLVELEITDKNKLSSKAPYVSERKGFNEFIYGTISIDTIEQNQNELLLSIEARDYPHTPLGTPVKVKFNNGKYTRLDE